MPFVQEGTEFGEEHLFPNFPQLLTSSFISMHSPLHDAADDDDGQGAGDEAGANTVNAGSVTKVVCMTALAERVTLDMTVVPGKVI